MGRGVCTVGKLSAVVPGAFSGPRVCRWLVAGAGLLLPHVPGTAS